MDKTILLNYKTFRKCGVCKEYIVLEEEFENVVWYMKSKSNKSFYHISCLRKKMLSKKGSLECDVDKMLSDIKISGLNHIENSIYKNHLYLYFYKYYGLIGFTNSFTTKMEEIFSGTFKQMSRGIPPEHILEMHQKPYMQKIFQKNFRRLEGENKLHYDLGSIIREYPSFLNWLDKRENEAKIEREKSKEILPNISSLISKQHDEKLKEDKDIFSDIGD